MYKQLKPMLNEREQIEHLLKNGVKFEIISEKDAEEYLKKNNNYFKLTAYRKNFEKYATGKNKGKYINLDFQMLIDLSIIDMRIRKSLLNIVLDLEHYTKIKLLNKVENTTKDGYSSVEKYIQNLKPEEYNSLECELNRHIKNTYCGDLVSKYNKEYPIWVFIEIIPFGRLIKFYKFVAENLQDKEMLNESYLLKNVRELRNACAHNNCILNNLRQGTAKPQADYGMLREISKIGISNGAIGKKISNARIQQIVTLLYLNKKITTSEGVLKYQKEMLQELKNRIERNIQYYSNNTLIKSNLNFLNRIIDTWYNNSV